VEWQSDSQLGFAPDLVHRGFYMGYSETPIKERTMFTVDYDEFQSETIVINGGVMGLRTDLEPSKGRPVMSEKDTKLAIVHIWMALQHQTQLNEMLILRIRQLEDRLNKK
jgi:hypothetical protein